MDSKIAHLEMVQAVITRMAGNSFLDAASHSNVQRADGCCAELASMSFEQSNKRLQPTPKKAVRFWVP